jgi:hypothetical protein
MAAMTHANAKMNELRHSQFTPKCSSFVVYAIVARGEKGEGRK